MTDNKDELLVRSFMQTHYFEVADDGFSARVMRHLPDRMLLLLRVWRAICVVAGVVLVCCCRALSAEWGMIKGWISDLLTCNAVLVTPGVLMLGFMAATLALGFGMLFMQEKHSW